jgi:hypothetical protein
MVTISATLARKRVRGLFHIVTTEVVDVGLMLSESLAAMLASLVTRSMGSHSDSGRPHD